LLLTIIPFYYYDIFIYFNIKNLIESKINENQTIISKQLLDLLDIITSPIKNSEKEQESGIIIQSEKILNRILKYKNNLTNQELDQKGCLNEYNDNLNEMYVVNNCYKYIIIMIY